MSSIPSERKNDHDDHQCQPLPTPYCALEMDLLVRNQWIHMIVCDSDLETLRQVFHDDDISCHSIDLTVEHRRKCSSESNNENDAKLPGKVNFQDHVDTDVIIVEENGYLEGTSVSGSTSYSVRLILFDLLCLAVTFMIIMAFIAVSALPIWAIETTSTNDWNYREAFFFIVDTLTKIGYGDLVPKSMGGKIYTACCIIVGLPLVSAWVAMVGTRFLSVTSHSFNIMRNYVGHDDNGKEETGSRGDRENRSRGSANEGNDNGALEQGNDNSNNSTGNNEPNNELNTGTLVSQTQSTPPVPPKSRNKCKRRRRHWMRVHYWSKRAISSHKFRLIIQIVIIVSFLLLGAMIFSLIENWTYWNSVYFVLNTVTTYVSLVDFGLIAWLSCDLCCCLLLTNFKVLFCLWDDLTE